MPIVPMTGKPKDSLYPEPEEQKIEINPLSYLNTPDTATEAEFAVAVDELAKMSPFGIRETGDYSQFGADNAKDAFYNLRKAILHGIESLSDDESRAWFETDPEDIETRYRIASENLPPSTKMSLIAGRAIVSTRPDVPFGKEYDDAPDEIKAASDRLRESTPVVELAAGEFYGSVGEFDITNIPAERQQDYQTILHWRDRQEKERTISAYSARIDAKNTLRKWVMMRPLLSDDADSLLQHIMADKPRDDEFDAKFMALPEEQQEVVMMLGRDLRNTPDKNMLRDSMTEFMIGGMRLFGDAAKEVRDLWMMAETDREDFQKQAEVKARMQELWAPKRSQEYGYWEDAIIGTISSLPYTGFTMATAMAGVPEVGLGVISLSMAQQFKRQIALQGGDVTDPKVLVLAQAAGIAYWGIEQAQVGTWMKSMTDLERRMATANFAHGIWTGYVKFWGKAEAKAKARKGLREAAPKLASDFAGDLLKEWLYEEEFQDLIEEGFVSWGIGEDVARNMAEQAVESLQQNFGTMLLMTGGFSGIGAARTGLSRKHTDQELYDAMHHRAQLVGSLHQRTELREKLRKGEEIDPREMKRLERDIDYQRRVLSTMHRAFNKAGGMEDAESAFQRMGLDPRQSFLAAYMFDQERRAIMGDTDLTQAEKEELLGKQATSLSLLRQAYPNRTFTENPDGTFTSSYTLNGAEVREIHQTGTIEWDPASPEGATSTVIAINAAEKAARLSGAPFSDNMKGMTEERWLDLTPEARNEIVQALDLRPEGNFIFTAKMAGSPDVAQVDEKQIRHLSGEITLAPDAAPSATFHEDLHAFVRYLRETGELTPQDIQKLREEFGDPRQGVNEDFNEEAAAETIRKMQSRSVRHVESTGAEAIMDKVFDVLDRIDLFRRKKKQAETVAENLMAQMRRGEWTGIPAGTITEAQRQKNAQMRQKARSKPKKQAKKPQEPTAKEPEQAQEPSEAEIQPEGQATEKPTSQAEITPQGEGQTAEEAAAAAEADEIGAGETGEVDADQPLGKGEWRAVTPKGNVYVRGEWVVVDMDDLKTSDQAGYDQSIQPRDRGTVRSRAQIHEIARRLNPQQLLDSARTDDGSPVMMPDGSVLSGNGRVIALREARDIGNIAKYEAVVRRRAAELGIAIPAEIKNPVLVRRMDSIEGPSTIQQVAELSNQPVILQRSEAEIAESDARAILDNGLLRLFTPGADGNVLSASNMDFINGLVQATGDASLVDSNNRPTEATRNRIRRALLALLVGEGENSREIVRGLVEDAKNLGMKTEVDGLMKAAADIVTVARDKPQYSLLNDIGLALRMYMDMKREGSSPFQADLFGRPEAVDMIVKALWGRSSIGSIAAIFSDYATRARLVDTSTGGLGLDKDPTKEELLKAAIDATGTGETAGQARFSVKANAPSSTAQDAEYMAAVERGDMETAQRIVDEAAKAAGYNVGPVWHGGAAGFNVFDWSKMGQQGTSEGKGFYFTNDRDLAKGYADRHGGRLMRVYLRGGERIDGHKLTFTVSQVKRILTDVHNRSEAQEEGSSPLWNYGDIGYEGKSAVIDKAARDTVKYSKDDVSLLAGLINGGADPESLYDSVYRVTGKTGIVEQDAWSRPGHEVHIATSASHVKLADPITRDDTGRIIPPSERFNPQRDDIRYSVKANAPSSTAQDAEYMAAVERGDMETAQRLVDEAAIRHTDLSESSSIMYEAYADAYGRPIEGARVFDEKGKRNPMPDGMVFPRTAHFVKNTDARHFWKIGDEAIFYRRGGLPPGGFSRNTRDNLYEKGVSVYPTPSPDSFAGVLDADWYFGAGKIVAAGSDGEPVIHPIGKWVRYPKDTNPLASISTFRQFGEGEKIVRAIIGTDPVTYDDRGRVIPLSERFSTRSPDIRFSVRARAPLFGNNNRAIASLAVQHLMGEKLDTERAEKAAYLFAASGTTPDQMIADAKKLAESKVAQEAKKHIENRDPNAAHRVMSQQAEYDSIVALRTGMKSGLKMGQEAERAKQAAEKKLLLNARGEDLQQFIIDTGIDWTETLLSSLPEVFAEWEKAREEAEKKAKEDGAPEGPQKVPEPPPADPAELEARDRRMRELVAATRAWGDAERAKREKEADDRRKKEQERIEKGEEADDTDADPGGEQAEGMEPEGLVIPKELLQAHGVDIRNAQEVAHLIRIWMADWLVRQSKGRLTHQTVWKDREAVEKYRKTMVAQLRDMANGMVEQGWSMTVIHNRISDIPSVAKPDTVERRTASIIAMIQAHSIRQTRAQLITDIRKNIKKKAIKGKRHDALNEDLERKINSEQELTARYLRRILTWSPEKVDAEIVAIQARLKERTELYSEQNPYAKVALDVEFHRDLMRLRVLQEWGGLNRMLPAQIKQAGIAIDGWLVSAQERLYRRWWAMEEQIGKLVTALNEGIVPDDPEQARIQVSRISGWIKDNIATVRQRLEGLIRQQHDPVKRQAAQAAIDEIMFILSRGTEVYRTVAQEYRQAFVDAVNEIAGGKRAARAYMKHLEEEIPIEVAEQVSRQGYNGRGGGRVMTYNQALQLYASITQRGFASNVKLHKREGHAALLESIFTTEDLALIARLREIYEERRGRLSEVVQEVSGMLVWRPDPLYMPVRVKMPKKGGFQSKGDPSTWMPLARSLTPRVHHELDFDESATLTGTFYDATEDAARAIGFGTRGLILRGVLGNSTIQESADRYYGGGEMADLNQQVVQALDGFGRTDQDSTHGMLRTIRELNAYAALSWNPLTALKQIVSFPVFAMALEGGFSQVMSAIKDFDRDAMREIMESDGFKARYKGGFMPEAAEILADGRSNIIARFYKLGMTTVQIGDFVPSLLVAPGLYKARLAQNLADGMDEATAKERAMTWTWEMIEATQQTSRAEMLPKFYRQTGAGSEAMKLILQFSSAPLLQLSHEYHAWRDAMAGVDGAWKRLGRAVLVNHIIIPQMLEMVTKMFYFLIGRDEPEDANLFWAILNGATIGAVNRIMIAGILADVGYNALVHRKVKWGGQMVPAESLMRTTGYGMMAVGDLLRMPFSDEATMEQFQADVVKALEGMLAPFRYGKEFYDNRIAQ